MKEVEINGKTYKIIKRYPHFTLCEDENGFKTGFNDFDLGLIKRITVTEVKHEQNEKREVCATQRRNCITKVQKCLKIHFRANEEVFK